MTLVAALVAVLAEALATGALGEWIATGYTGSAEAFPLAGFAVVALLGFALAKGLAVFELRRRWRLVLAGAGSYAVLYGALRFVFAGDVATWDLSWVAEFFQDPDETSRRGGRAFVAALLLTALWARAVYRGGTEVDLERFPRGVLPALGVAVVAATLASPSERAEEVARAAFASVVFGTMALVVSQLARSGMTFGQLRAGSFALLLVGAVVGAVGGAVVLFGLAYGAVAPVVGEAVLEAAIVVLTWVLTPVVWLVDRLVALIRPDEPSFRPAADVARGLLGGAPAEEGEPGGPLQVVGYLGRALLLLLLVAAFALLGLGAFRFWRGVAGAGATVTVEPAGSPAGALRRFFGYRGKAAGSPVRRASHPVVALYVRVLAAAERRGVRRSPGSTPRELQPVLRTTFGDVVTDHITDALERVRYAGRPVARAEVERMADAWREVERREGLG